MNQGRHKQGHYMDYFDLEALELLESRYDEDFKNFGYEHIRTEI